MRNGKVYLSAPAGNTPAVAALLAAFKAKKLNVWRGPASGATLSPEAAQELDRRDTLVRILDADTASAAQMAAEFAEFRRLGALDAQQGQPNKRVVFDLIMDGTYQRQPEDAAAQFTIKTTDKPESAWLPTIFSEAGQLKAATGGVNSPVIVLGTVALVCILAMATLAVIGNLPELFAWLGNIGH
jgi:hypothetical protein